MNILLLLILLSLGLFIFLTFKERRTILYGVSLVLLFVSFNIGIVILIERSGNGTLIPFILLAAVLFTVIISASPFILTLTLIIEGCKNLIKEGWALRNVLAVSIGLLLMFSPLITRFFIEVSHHNIVVVTICNIYYLIAGYLIVIASAFTLSSLLNFINFNKRDLNYVVVLGAGLNGDRVTPLLASRIEKGIAVYKQQKNCKLIMSGGQGADELISEAEAMQRYALSRGVQPADIILEHQSTSTLENIKYSVQLMTGTPKFAIVTNYYHLFRALLMANELGIKCIGYGSATKFYFTINAFVREFIGYLAVKYKLHMGLISLIIFFYLAVAGVLKFYNPS